MRHVGLGIGVRLSSFRPRKMGRSGIDRNLYCLRHRLVYMAEPRAGLQSHGRSVLARIRTHHRASIHAESVIQRMGLGSEYKRLASFTIFASVWCIGWLVYMGGDVLQVRGIWRSVLIWLDLLHGFPDMLDQDSGYGLGEFTESWGSGGNLMDQLIELLGKSGNWGAMAFGLFGMVVTGFFGWLLKRPMVKQAAENERFKAIREGHEGLISQLQARNRYLEEQDQVHTDYQALLVKRLRECEERHLSRSAEGG